MKHGTGEGSITRPVDHQSSSLPLRCGSMHSLPSPPYTQYHFYLKLYSQVSIQILLVEIYSSKTRPQIVTFPIYIIKTFISLLFPLFFYIWNNENLDFPQGHAVTVPDVCCFTEKSIRRAEEVFPINIHIYHISNAQSCKGRS